MLGRCGGSSEISLSSNISKNSAYLRAIGAGVIVVIADMDSEGTSSGVKSGSRYIAAVRASL